MFLVTVVFGNRCFVLIWEHKSFKVIKIGYIAELQRLPYYIFQTPKQFTAEHFVAFAINPHDHAQIAKLIIRIT